MPHRGSKIDTYRTRAHARIPAVPRGRFLGFPRFPGAPFFFWFSSGFLLVFFWFSARHDRCAVVFISSLYGWHAAQSKTCRRGRIYEFGRSLCVPPKEVVRAWSYLPQASRFGPLPSSTSIHLSPDNIWAFFFLSAPMGRMWQPATFSLSQIYQGLACRQSNPDAGPHSIRPSHKKLEAKMAKFTTALFLIAALFTVSACNTMHGIGRDVESAGDAVADAAKD